MWRWCSADTASRARSWRPRRCSRRSGTRQTPTSTRRWRETSVAAAPTPASAPRSSPRRQADVGRPPRVSGPGVPGVRAALRRAGAAWRSLLGAAAASTWDVDPASCHAARGAVIHGPTGRSLGYGALVDKAATLRAPSRVPLKDPKDFRLIGTPAKRVDAPGKVDGTAQFGIDVRLPGMKVARSEERRVGKECRSRWSPYH